MMVVIPAQIPDSDSEDDEYHTDSNSEGTQEEDEEKPDPGFFESERFAIFHNLYVHDLKDVKHKEIDHKDLHKYNCILTYVIMVEPDERTGSRLRVYQKGNGEGHADLAEGKDVLAAGSMCLWKEEGACKSELGCLYLGFRTL